jgi:putative endonuclease
MTFVYMVECADGTYYTGWTADLDRRIAAHNAGRGGRYTRSRRPVKLVYWEEHPDRRSAQQRELALKRLSRARKTTLITGFESTSQRVSQPESQ